MTFPLPQGELLRRAVAHMATSLKENPEQTLSSVLDETSMRFNLSPVDSESLSRLFERPAHHVDAYVGHTNLAQK